MPSQILCDSSGSKCSRFLFLVLKSCLLFFYLGSVLEASCESINVGALINVDSHVGKEQKTAMIIAAESFNNISRNHNLIIHFRNISTDPIQAVSAAEGLVREKQVKVIIGLETWGQATLVADVGKRAQVPVLSLAAATNAPKVMQPRWPYLVPMTFNILEQINCIAAIVRSYHWRRVIAIYEEDTSGGDSGTLALLSEALQGVDAEIESHLALPPASSHFDSEGIIREEVVELLKKQSRVFIVLQSSLSQATLLFREAGHKGLVGRDSVWIIANTLSDVLDSVGTSYISSMQGALGIKNYYSEDTRQFLDFKHQFQRNFRLEYPNDHSLEPGIHALQAYDGITAISKAVEKLGSESTKTSTSLLSQILSSNFTGLTGEIHFHSEALSDTSIFRIVNIVGKSYKELGFWSSSFRFSEKLIFENAKMKLSAVKGVESIGKLSRLVNWPGELDRIPKGWAMPTNEKPMKIGIPGRTSFEKFVKVEWEVDKSGNKYDGFCIELFEKVLKILEPDYTIPYEFVPYNGTYDALLDHVINKTFDAVVGDITILANRSSYVEFTQPFAVSGLSMLVPMKHEPQRAWIFMKPFTRTMWLATSGIMFYTMFVVWFIEHQSKNPEFRGPWKQQLGTTLWFTFSSLFFAHKEKIISNYAKLVVVVWLFVVYVFTSSYQASLTSMLTVGRLEPNVTDIDWIRRTNAPVGCDGDSFVKDYLKNVIKLQNIKTIGNEVDYPGEFESGNITAAFLELPYQKVFLNEHCNQFTVTGPTYRFGGQGFVFQKGSPIARDVSKAILTLLEKGKLKGLEDEWFGSSMNCSSSEDSVGTESLSFDSFWALYLVSGVSSTICLLIFLVRLLRKTHKQLQANQNDAAQSKNGIISMVVELAQLSIVGRPRSMGRAPTFFQRWSSSQWDLVSPSDPSEKFDASPPSEVEISVKDH